MIYDFVQQGSMDWFALRLGRVTASNAGAIIGTEKARRRYMIDLASETIMGIGKTIHAKTLDHGNKYEPLARSEYIFLNGAKGREIGFFVPDWNTRLGYSPDFVLDGISPIVKPDWALPCSGLAEIKCPVDLTLHIEAILDGINEKHVPQCQFGLWVTKADWIDFVSFTPYLPAKSRYHCKRIYPDLDMFELFEEKVPQFILDLDSLIDQLVDGSFTEDVWRAA